jgi:multidrug resistance efflux pump
MNLLVTITGTLVVFLLMKMKVLKHSTRTLVIAAITINMAFRFFVLIPMQYFSPAGELRVLRNTVQVVPRVPGQVIAVHVSSQDKVKAGDPLFSLDPRDYAADVARLEGAVANAETQASLFDEQVRSAEANLEASRRQLTVAEAQYTSSPEETLRSAEAGRKAATASFMLAEKERQRVQDLYSQKVTTADEFDRARQSEAVARNALRAAEADEATARIAVMSGGSQVETARQKVYFAESALRQAKTNSTATSDGMNPLVAQARAQLANAKLKLEWTTVTAPIAGTVLNVQLRPGQQVGAAPVMVLQDDSVTKFAVAIKQSIVRHVKVGDKAEMFFDKFPGDHFPAKVTSVSQGVEEGQLVATGNLFSASELNKRTPIAVMLEPDDPNLPGSLQTGAGGIGAVFTDKFTLTRVPRKVVCRMLSWWKFILP